MSQTTAQLGYIYKEPGPEERSRRRRSVTIWMGGFLFLAGLAIAIIFAAIFIQQAVTTLSVKPTLRSPMIPGQAYQAQMKLESDLVYRSAFWLNVSSTELVDAPQWAGLSQSPDYRLLASIRIRNQQEQLVYSEEILLTPYASLETSDASLTQQDDQHILKVERALPDFEVPESGNYRLEATITPIHTSTDESGQALASPSQLQQAEFLIYTENNEKSSGTWSWFILLGTGALLGLLLGIFGALLSMIGMILGAHRLKLILREELARIPRA